MAIFLGQKTIKSARKKHTCCFCGGDINIGDSYLITTSRARGYGGYIDSFKQHDKCRNLTHVLGIYQDPWDDAISLKRGFQECVTEYVFEEHPNFEEVKDNMSIEQMVDWILDNEGVKT